MTGGVPRTFPVRVDGGWRWRGTSNNERWFSIRVEDAVGGSVLWEMEIPVEAFLDLLSNTGGGLRQPTTEIRFYGLDRVGLEHQSTGVYLKLRKGSQSALSDAVNMATNKLDAAGTGWQISDRDADWNGHRWDHGTGTYRVPVWRYVEPGTPTDDPQAVIS